MSLTSYWNNTITPRVERAKIVFLDYVHWNIVRCEIAPSIPPTHVGGVVAIINHYGSKNPKPLCLIYEEMRDGDACTIKEVAQNEKPVDCPHCLKRFK